MSTQVDRLVAVSLYPNHVQEIVCFMWSFLKYRIVCYIIIVLVGRNGNVMSAGVELRRYAGVVPASIESLRDNDVGGFFVSVHQSVHLRHILQMQESMEYLQLLIAVMFNMCIAGTSILIKYFVTNRANRWVIKLRRKFIDH